ncbi:hypothetical protein FQA39_LY06532 [Lamprigera yunnana]|nr:hypothetical protein FQA39_LY06532 [Lamprigera yunnana]
MTRQTQPIGAKMKRYIHNYIIFTHTGRQRHKQSTINSIQGHHVVIPKGEPRIPYEEQHNGNGVCINEQVGRPGIDKLEGRSFRLSWEVEGFENTVGGKEYESWGTGEKFGISEFAVSGGKVYPVDEFGVTILYKRIPVPVAWFIIVNL